MDNEMLLMGDETVDVVDDDGDTPVDPFPAPAPVAAAVAAGGGGCTCLPRAKRPLSAVTFNFANSIIGAGVLGLPLVLKECGVILGLCLLLLGGTISTYTLRLLHRGYMLEQVGSYEEYAESQYGAKGRIFISVVILFGNLGCLIAYQVILIDLITPIISALSTGTTELLSDSVFRFVISLANALVLFLVCLPKKIATFRWTSLLSLLFVAAFTCIVITLAFESEFPAIAETIPLFVFSHRIFLVLGIIVFAFSCHSLVHPISSEVQDQNQPRVPPSMVSAFLICFVVYTTIGVFGFLSFGSSTEGNIIRNYPPTIALNVFRGLLAVTLVLTFPLCLYPARVSADLLLFPNDRTSRTRLRFVLLTLASVLVTWIAAVFIPSVGVVFNLTGGLTGSLLCCILPCWLLLKAEGIEIRRDNVRAWALLMSIVAYGVLVGVAVTATEVFVLISKHSLGATNATSW